MGGSKPRPVRGNGFARRSSFSSTAENRRHHAGLDHDDLHTERRHLETQRIRDSFHALERYTRRTGKRPPRSMRKRSQSASPPFTHAGRTSWQAHRPKTFTANCRCQRSKNLFNRAPEIPALLTRTSTPVASDCLYGSPIEASSVTSSARGWMPPPATAPSPNLPRYNAVAHVVGTRVKRSSHT